MNKEKHSKEVVEIANTIVNECGNAPCKECMWCDAATWAHAKALYNADYRKQEWISVDERLPEENGRYLACVKISHLAFDIPPMVVIMEYNKIHGFYTISGEETVTHWMPLPEAPKMKGGAE